MTTQGGRGRRLFIDWARGLAVLCMIEHHAFDAWMPESFHGSAADRLFRFVGGIAAPSFLFLAGLAVALSLEGQAARGADRFAAAWAAARRGGVLLLGAYLFRAQEWALAFGAAPAEQMLRIDILNCIGVALAVVALCWACAGSPRGRALALAGAGCAVFFAAPVVWAAPLSRVPQLLADYLRGQPPRALFPLFPWAGYAFAGALCGIAFAQVRAAKDRARAEARLVAGLAAFSILLCVAVLLVDRLPGRLYPEMEWWKTSPAYSLLRCCSEVWLLCLCWCAEKAWTRLREHRFGAQLREGPLLLLGRHSLLVYWVHVEIVYGRLTWPVRGKLGPTQAGLSLALLIAAMVALSWAAAPAARAWQQLAASFRPWQRLRASFRVASPGSGPAGPALSPE